MKAKVRELSSLLARYGWNERSGYLARVAALDDLDDVLREVAGPEFWGGSGAIWEAPPFDLTDPSNRSASDDYTKFQRLLVELADELAARGLDDLARPRADYLRRQLKDRM